jgi:methionyl-tRNA formyltransferase
LRLSLPYLFAGDRQLAVDALQAVLALDDPPSAVVVSDTRGASHASQLAEIAATVPDCMIVASSEFRSPTTVERLAQLGLDMALSVHFPEIVREPLLSLPARGWLNIHPAFLPYNRGWHTPSWSILDGTPAGATIHAMTPDVDAGAILARREVKVEPSDTAHTLYRRLLDTELMLLTESWSLIRGPAPWPLIVNDVGSGTLHHRSDLAQDHVQLLDVDAPTTARAVIDRLRALTTDRWEEAIRFTVDGRTYRARIAIRHDGEEPSSWAP